MSEPCDLSISASGEALRCKDVSVRELVESVLRRAGATEPILHAYAHLDAGSALAQADAADAVIRRGGSVGPLHGIPIAVKDLIDVRTMPTTGGSRALSAQPAASDAAAVSAFRRAGAIILGKTVSHELGFGANVPLTRNAWNVSRAPGGSSAGSAVSVAAGSAMAALGTDTGGSVRVPASLNGIVGLKPSFGAINTGGALRMSPGLDTIGLLARTADDALLLLDALLADTNMAMANTTDAVADLRLGYLERGAAGPVDAEVQQAVRTALDELVGLGASVEKVCWPNPGLTAAVGMITVLSDSAAEYAEIVRDRWARLDPGTLATLVAGAAIPDETRDLARRLRTVLVNEVNTIFRDDSLNVLALPSFPVSAGTPDDLLSGDAEASRTAMELQMIANLTGLPAITLPCGFTADEMPIGLQLIGRPGSDRTLVHLGSAFQCATSWQRRRPPLVEANSSMPSRSS